MRPLTVSKGISCLHEVALTLLLLFASPFAFAEQQQEGPQESLEGLNPEPGSLGGLPDKLTITRSGDYYFGRSFSMSREEALQNSKADLINKIVTRVVSQATQGFSEDDEAYRSYYNQTTQTASRLELRGLDYMEEQRRDDSWEVTAFISKEDFQKSLEKETERQTGLFRSARSIEQDQGLNQAIPWYYSAYLNTFFFPDLLILELEEGETADAQTWYRNRIQEWQSQLEFEVGLASGDMVQDLFQAEVPLTIKWKDEPVRALAVGLDLPDYGKIRTVEGRTNLFIDRLPERLKQTYRIVYQLVLEETPANRDLNQLGLKTGPFFQRDLIIDFSQIIQVGMSVRKLSDTAIRFTPSLRNLSVAQFEWIFGNEDSNNEQSPILQLADVQEPMDVTLTVNGDPDLRVRRIYDDGKLLDPDRPTLPVLSLAAPAERPALPTESPVAPAESPSLPTESPVAPAESPSQPTEPPVPPPAASNPASLTPAPEASPTPATAESAPPETRPFTGSDARALLNRLPLTEREKGFVLQLRDVDTAEGLQSSLAGMMRVERIRSGGVQAVSSPEQSFIAIFDPDRMVKAFLTPEVAGIRTDLRTGREIRDLATTYKGLAPIYIQFF